MQIYNVASNTWARSLTLPLGLNTVGSASAVVAFGYVYVCGGINAAGATISNCAMYGLASGTFTTMASMPVGVNHAAFACDGVRLYVVGGRCV